MVQSPSAAYAWTIVACREQQPGRGVKLAKNCNVGLAALDYEMPRMIAVEIAQRLRAIQPTIRIIVISGTELPEEPARVVDCFVPKTQMVRILA